MLRIFIVLIFAKLLILPVFAESKQPAGSVSEQAPREKAPRPEFDRDNPKTNGIILSFKTFPLTPDQKKQVLERIKFTGLKESVTIKRFKLIAFEWDNWHEGKLAREVCDKFLDLDFLKYCEPSLLKGPAGARKKAKKIIRKNTETKNRPRPVEAFSNKAKNLRTCNITTGNFNLRHGKLSDYWAQDMIGADFMKQELKKARPVKKHLVAVFDNSTPLKQLGRKRHDTAVRNIISNKGQQAVLPEIGHRITLFDTSNDILMQQATDRLLSRADRKCQPLKEPIEDLSP